MQTVSGSYLENLQEFAEDSVKRVNWSVWNLLRQALWKSLNSGSELTEAFEHAEFREVYETGSTATNNHSTMDMLGRKPASVVTEAIVGKN